MINIRIDTQSFIERDYDDIIESQFENQLNKYNMRESIIQSVSEAFSMQPTSYYVGGQIWPSGEKVSRIEKITEVFEDDKVYIAFYAGFSEDGTKLFQVVASAANVMYSPVNPKEQNDDLPY